MNLFLLRHAIAEEIQPGQRDSDRRLTSKGKKRFRPVVRAMGTLGIEPDALLSSPWRRSMETAELLRPLGVAPQPLEYLARAPSDELLREIRGANVVLVGHEPWMGELASLLITGTVDRADAFAFKKGGLLWLEGTLETRRFAVRACMPPKWLRALAE